MAVVYTERAQRIAYERGYTQFRTSSTDEADMYALSEFKSGAYYINVLLPELRALAGFADTGTGTYTIDRPVAAIVSGTEDDRPMSAVRMSSNDMLTMIIQAWDGGAHTQLAGDDPQHEEYVAPFEPTPGKVA
jgi:hypothetical protein